MYYWRGCLRHRLTLLQGDRLTHETYTRFTRVPGQFEALAGPVVERLKPQIRGRALRIISLGCSNGSEAFSIASFLHHAHPELDFEVLGTDIAEEALVQAQSGEFSRDEIYNHELVTEEFVAQTFWTDPESPDTFRVKPELRERISFLNQSTLDPQIAEKLGCADVVFAQNTLFNMDPKTAQQMFASAVSLLQPHGFLFVDGADLHQRAQLTRRFGLTPLNYRVREIHEEVMHIRAKGWPNIYWGIEPFWAARSDRERRYATIFSGNAR